MPNLSKSILLAFACAVYENVQEAKKIKGECRHHDERKRLVVTINKKEEEPKKRKKPTKTNDDEGRKKWTK